MQIIHTSIPVFLRSAWWRSVEADIMSLAVKLIKEESRFTSLPQPPDEDGRKLF
ncbi:MAG: hypothetical protein HZA77_03215 [Candidatus Schekmanbacteria bacterium]|nr:hypothetical protein [Candidatus Schekmanbacteria bacterium]